MIWELVFMLVILKIPVVYLCAVVWWAIRAEPPPLAGALLAAHLDSPPGCDWRRSRGRGRLRGPRPGAGGRFAGPRAVALARALARADRTRAVA